MRRPTCRFEWEILIVILHIFCHVLRSRSVRFKRNGSVYTSRATTMSDTVSCWRSIIDNQLGWSYATPFTF